MMCAMTRQIRHELTYEAPLHDVAAMLGDPAFRDEVCRAQRVSASDIDITPAGPGPKEVVVDQQRPAQGLPSFAARFVGGDTLRIVQRETWTSSSEADITIEIPGKPGEVAGTVRLAESGGTTTETVAMEIKVKIPLVGGKAEGLIGDLLLKALRAENRVGRDYLSR